MVKINKKREALRETLGDGARLFEPGAVTVIMIIKYHDGDGRCKKQQVVLGQADGEHDGSWIISQVGGVISFDEILDRSDRGTIEGRQNIKG